MDFGSVQYLQAQLFPVCPLTPAQPAATNGGRGFLGSFLSKGLRTNQLEVNTDEKTLRQIARLKEPRDLFALPKDKDHDCPQQAPRWPIECQVIDERIVHIPYVPPLPERLNQTTGNELKPRPVGEENGIVVFNYNPISAVNYDSSPRKNSKKRGGSSDSDASSSESRGSSPERLKDPMNATFAKYFEALHSRSTSHSTDDYDDDEAATGASGSLDVTPTNGDRTAPYANGRETAGGDQAANDAIEDIWANKSPEYNAATPTYIRSQFGKGSARANGVIPPVRLRSECMNRVKLGRSPQAKLKESAATKGKGISSTPTISTTTTATTTSSSTNKFSTITASTTSSPIKCTKAHATKKQSSSTSSLSDADGNECDRDRGADVLVAINPKKRLSGGTCKGQAKSKTDTPEANAADLTSGPNARDKDNDDDDDDEDENEDEFADESPSNDNENLPQFSRSAVGGSKLLTNCHPFQNDDTYDGLEFESRFESGNLAKAVMITQTYYELYLRPDLYTSRSKQWFYFRVRKTKKNVIYRFSIVNLVKSDSLYNEGMRPLMYSTINATNIFEGWRRCGENIAYYRNEEEGASGDDDEENSSFTLTFNVEFPNDDDTVYFAHSYPYTYSELQDYLMSIQKHPVKSKFCKLRLLCRSLAGNNVYYLTVTAPTNDEEAMKRKKAIVVSGRVHPSETPSSWMMKGLMDFITGDTMVAKRLRHKFIFKLIPMLNPDGVIVGNTRNSLTGKDLNRQYRTVIRETYPSIWYTKAMIKRLIDECGVAMYCDMHAHSRKHNIFIYGCENKRVPEKKLTEQVFPLMMHKNVADKFSFESCKFKIQRSKEGTGRIVVWMLGITNSYTLEASFGGSTLASRKGTHYTTADYEHIGRAFCETLLDYGDENPTKERLRLKIIERLLKEGSSAEEPLNIPLSDYSSDEGDTSISSENEGKNSIRLSDLEGPCCAPTKAPPSSPEVTTEMRKFRINRMRKIMFELDRLYFQPLLHLRFRTALRKRARRKRPAKPNHPSATRLEGGEDGGKTEGPETTHQSSASEPSEPEVTEETNMSVLAETLMGLNAEALGMKLSCVAVKPAKAEVQPQPSNTSMTCPSTETITPPAPNKKSTTCRRKRKGRKARDATAGNDGADAPEGKSNKKRVSRPLRLFLAARKIIIYRRRKQRKFRVRSKSSQSKRNRTPIDLPTTDPGSDLHFSTDDEMPLDTVHSIYSTVPRTRRILLQSELQRRYIEEIGDGLETKFMPPELIITTPNKVNHQKHRPPPQIRFTLQPPPQTAPQQAKETLMEFPLIGNPTPRRTNSWHNLHTKSMAKSKVQSPYQWLETNNQEELAMKLSLKKKIWTGVHPDNGNGNGPGVDRSRPLSWLMPPQIAEQQHSATRTTCFVKRERTIISSGHLAHGRDPALDLFNACSQKLMAWQKEVPNSPRDHLILSLPTPDRETVGSGLRSSTSKQAVHLKKKNADKPPNRQLPLDSNNATDTVPAKLKRKKNPLTKIAETTQILSRLAKTTSSSTMQRQTKSGVSVAPHIRSATAGYTLGYNNNNNNKLPNAPSQSATTNKFKTGGIVATAVQPSTKRRKKLRSLAVKKQDCSQLATAAAPLKAKASAGATTTNALQLKGAVSSSSFMRKVKSKIKRKKSNTAALNEGSGSGVGGGGGLVTSGSHTTHDFRRSSTTTTTTMTIEMMTRKMKELPYM